MYFDLDADGDCEGDAFPELKRDPAFVKQVINDEEKSFRKTLARGQRLFAKVCETHAADKVIPGDVAWQLYDTYGFPIDLTKLMAQERGFTVDRVGFDAARLKAQEISRAIVKTVNVSVDLDVHAISELKNKGVPETNDAYGNHFVFCLTSNLPLLRPKYDYSRDAAGQYTFPKSSGKVLAIRYQNTFVDSVTAAEGGSEIGLVLSQTSFYAEQGGQATDQGFISTEAGADIKVTDVQKKGPFVLHIGVLELGSINIGDEVSLAIDETVFLVVFSYLKRLKPLGSPPHHEQPYCDARIELRPPFSARRG